MFITVSHSFLGKGPPSRLTAHLPQAVLCRSLPVEALLVAALRLQGAPRLYAAEGQRLPQPRLLGLGAEGWAVSRRGILTLTCLVEKKQLGGGVLIKVLRWSYWMLLQINGVIVAFSTWEWCYRLPRIFPKEHVCQVSKVVKSPVPEVKVEKPVDEHIRRLAFGWMGVVPSVKTKWCEWTDVATGKTDNSDIFFGKAQEEHNKHVFFQTGRQFFGRFH